MDILNLKLRNPKDVVKDILKINEGFTTDGFIDSYGLTLTMRHLQRCTQYTLGKDKIEVTIDNTREGSPFNADSEISNIDLHPLCYLNIKDYVAKWNDKILTDIDVNKKKLNYKFDK